MADSETLLSVQTGAILLAIFSALWIAYALYTGSKAKNMEGFMLAGRNVGMAFGTATAMATWVTSNTIMLAPKFGLQLGLWGLLAYATASFGLFLFAPMARRIQTLLPEGYTSGDFIRLRYGNVTWGLYLVITLVYSTTWLVSMGMAGGIVLEALSGLDYTIGMSVIMGVCVVYTIFGGLYAVIGTDFIQSIIILVGVVVVGAVVLLSADFTNLYDQIETERPMLVTVLMPVALMSLFNNMFFGFGEVFHNNVWWSRAYAMRKSVVSKAYALSGLLWLPIPIAAGFIGLFAVGLGISIADPDMVGPLVSATILGNVGAVFVFVIVFCSLASSIDSLLAATADLVTEDIYRKIINPKASDNTLRRGAVGVIIVLGALTWLFCYLRMGSLIQVLFMSGPFVASLIWPIVCGLYWTSVNRTGVIAAIVVSSLTGLYVYFAVGWFVATLVAAAVSFIITIGSTMLAPQTYDWKRLQEV